ncbi:ROK family protein [Microbacterium lushaniae]|nr:ROK family protein [Microbacterium lushaniae]KAA9150753.1 ROK family protein [Microbacterium lushaniae]
MTTPRTGIEGVRAGNLGRILRRVHVAGAASRATLTAELGLNRSTIADLVGELVDLGFVHESAPGPERRVGRPSPVVTTSPGVVAIAVNPEVDALEIAAVRLDRGIPHRVRLEMDHLLDPHETARLVREHIDRWRAAELAGATVAGIGVAVPGLVRGADGVVRTAPHLGWTDVPLCTLMAEATGLPVVVANDASLGILAEHRFGAARGIDDVVYLNGGASGIGGGVIVQGMTVGGAGGYAGEFGQNRPGIVSDSDRRAPGGVLEDEVSRARLLEVLGMTAADEPALAAALAGSGSAAVTAETARQRRILATALANAVNVLNPSVIVLGGFLATLAELDLPAFTGAVAAQAMPASAEGLDVRVASLAAERLLIGAAEAVFEPLLEDPAAGARASATTPAG